MTLRPRNLLDVRTQDNTQQVTSATVQSASEFFKSINSVAEFGLPPDDVSWVTDGQQSGWTATGEVEISVLGGGGTTPNEFRDGFMVGMENGYVALFTQDESRDPVWQLEGDLVLAVEDDTKEPAVRSINKKDGSKIADAVGSDGVLYRLTSLDSREGDPSGFGFSPHAIPGLTIGGDPYAQMGRLGNTDDVFVAQPPGQAGEIYRRNTDTGTTVWTASVGGGFRGPVRYISSQSAVVAAHTDGSGNGFLTLFNESDGSQAWQTSTDHDVRGDITVDNGYIYYAVVTSNTSLREYVGRIDVTDGSKDWEYERSLNSEGSETPEPSVAVGDSNVFAYPLLQSDQLAAFNKTDGAKQWETDVTSAAYGDITDFPTIRTTVEVVGRAVYVSIPDDGSGNAKIESYDTENGSVITDRQTAYNPGLGINSDFADLGPDLLVAGDDSDTDADIFDTATRGIIGPVQTDSRPFLAVGSDSVGSYTAEVYGADSDDEYSFEDGDGLPKPYLQEQLDFTGGDPAAEQAPWWSWKYLWVRVDDPDAEAGDVDLTVTTAR